MVEKRKPMAKGKPFGDTSKRSWQAKPAQSKWSKSGDGARGSKPYGSDDNKADKPYRADDARGGKPFRPDANKPARPFNAEDRPNRPFRPDDNRAKPYRSDDNRGAKPYGAGDNRGARPYRADDNRGAKPYGAGDNRGAKPYRSDDNRAPKPYGTDDNRAAKPYSANKSYRPSDAKPYKTNRPEEGKSDKPYAAKEGERTENKGLRADWKQDGKKPEVRDVNKEEKSFKTAVPPKKVFDKQNPRAQGYGRFASDPKFKDGFDNDFSGEAGEGDKLEGRNSVLEALKAGRTINKILISKGDHEGSIKQIMGLAREKGLIVQEVDRVRLDNLSDTHAHQGVIAFVAVKDYVEVDDILEIARKKEQAPFIIILDEITDSYNLGSILRTADAVGAHGVIIPKRRAVGLTPAVSKASAGAIEYMPVARVTNIAQTIDYLKEQNIWVVGTDATGQQAFYNSDMKGSVALVIGSEGEGMGRLVREKCDFVVNIPMKGMISSLNAAVAGAIVMYEIQKQRSK